MGPQFPQLGNGQMGWPRCPRTNSGSSSSHSGPFPPLLRPPSRSPYLRASAGAPTVQVGAFWTSPSSASAPSHLWVKLLLLCCGCLQSVLPPVFIEAVDLASGVTPAWNLDGPLRSQRGDSGRPGPLPPCACIFSSPKWGNVRTYLAGSFDSYVS